VVFSSYSFIFIFLPLALFGFFLIARFKTIFAAGWLFICSLAFYGWWDYRYVALLIISIVLNFAAGSFLARQNASSCLKQALLIAGVAANIALLGYYKYAGFLARAVGWSFDDIVLPLGISFFTLTQIAYLVDSYRGQGRRYRFVHYGLFVSYFPHLLAGPILLHREMIPQFEHKRIYRPNIGLIAVGVVLFTIGLCKKVLLADTLALAANQGFAIDSSAHDAVSAWIMALAYTLQLYFDFSGYSDMAIGISLMFGIKLPVNFASPYKAGNIIEFWRRWHMTLSRFLRDYLYVPLGGSRRGALRRYGNLMLTMLVGGLWHGAGWQFIFWGGLHGAYLIVNHAWRGVAPRQFATARLLKLPLTSVGTAVTFVAVVCAWVFFRAESVSAAFGILRAMVGLQGSGMDRLAAQYRAAALEASSGFGPFDAAAPIAWSADVFFALVQATYLNWSLGLPGQLLVVSIGLFIVFATPNSQHITMLCTRDVAKGDATAYAILWRPSVRRAVVTGVLLAVALYKLLTHPSTPFLYFNF
jgi:alginate O-acetyltransferase complex protein AlgI